MRSSCRRASRPRRRSASRCTRSETSCPSVTTAAPPGAGTCSRRSSSARSPRSKRQARTASSPPRKARASPQARWRSDGYLRAACAPEIQRHSPSRSSSSRKRSLQRATRPLRTTATAPWALRPIHWSSRASSPAPRLRRPCTTCLLGERPCRSGRKTPDRCVMLRIAGVGRTRLRVLF